MGVDYDLVIVGGSLAGRYAAAAAVAQGARVALVEPHPAETDPYFLSQVWLQAWQQVAMAQVQRYQAGMWGLPSPDLTADPLTTVDWSQTTAWSQAIAAQTISPLSRDRLTLMGVDVIPETGQFQQRPHLRLLTETRSLTARAYLLAPASQAIVPALAGLPAVGYLTPITLGQRVTQLPPQLAIVGQHPSSVILAQALNRLGVEVTLITADPYLLVHLDPDIALVLQAQLEAEGVRVLTQCAITQVAPQAARVQIHLGSHALGAHAPESPVLDVDALLVAAGWQLAWGDLNLESLGLKRNAPGDRDAQSGQLRLNRHLQTSHPRIYCCNQTDSETTRQQQVRVALRNALFWPLWRTAPQEQPQLLPTQPEVASVGLLAAQAYRRYGQDRVWVLQQSMATIAAAQVQSQTSGFCKLVVHRNGTLLGAHLLGPGATSLIAPITLALRQRLKVAALAQGTPALPADLTVPGVALAALVSQTAAQWPVTQWQHSPIWQNVLESFFGWRRC